MDLSCGICVGDDYGLGYPANLQRYVGPLAGIDVDTNISLHRGEASVLDVQLVDAYLHVQKVVVSVVVRRGFGF